MRTWMSQVIEAIRPCRVLRSLLLILLIASPLYAAVPTVSCTPDLKPQDVRFRMREVLRSHATYKKLDTQLIARALENFVELLDPQKTYLLEGEVRPYLRPSPDLLLRTLKGYERDDYSTYRALFAQMSQAITRRRTLEEELAALPLPNGVDAAEFEKLTFAATPADLKERLMRFRALQLEIAHNFSEEPADALLERVRRRRMRHEDRLVGATNGEKGGSDREKMLFAHVLKATVSSLDGQSAYFTPEEASDFVDQLQRRLFGIGVQMRESVNGCVITQIVEGGPSALQGGINENDIIIAVDGEPVIGYDILDIRGRIRGPMGSTVDLTLLRDVNGEEKCINARVIRGEVVLKETRIAASSEPCSGGSIGIIALHSFYQDENHSSALDLRSAIESLQAGTPLKGLILDLRENTGGLLPQAIAVTGLFITKGIVASVKDEAGKIHHLRHTDSNIAYQGPLVVLVSRMSASASEIVAGTLQDYGSALIVGDPTTYGKGTYQTSTIDSSDKGTINPKGELKVTRGIYYTVSGRSPQLIGVLSDIVVPGPLSELEVGERYSKFPLTPDQIKENFSDELDDIPYPYRQEIKRSYRFDLQPKVLLYRQYLPLLKERSAARLASNAGFQRYLTLLKGSTEAKIEAADSETRFPDFQKDEAVAIVKDLLSSLNHQSARPGLKEPFAA